MFPNELEEKEAKAQGAVSENVALYSKTVRAVSRNVFIADCVSAV